MQVISYAIGYAISALVGNIKYYKEINTYIEID